MSQPECNVRPLESTPAMQTMMSSYYDRLRQAKADGRKICWATGSAPTDIVMAMDFFPAYPENHAAACGASHVGTQLCEVAEQHGYSSDLCSYARNCLGSCLSTAHPSQVPPLPAPDIILATTMCTTHVKWWEALGRHFGVPVLIIETPFVHDSLSIDERQTGVRYVVEQLNEAVKFLEDFCGRAYNYDRLQESVSNTTQTAGRFAEFVNMARHKPSPITSFDTFVHLGPMMALRGFSEPISYYDLLLKEVRQRVRDGISAVGLEKYRLYWDNIPVWYRLGWMGRKLAASGACTVAATYPFSWVNCFGNLDVDRPIETIAEGQAFFYQNKGTRQRIEFLVNLTRDFSVDGLLGQVSVSCKAFVPDQQVIIREAQKVTGLPAAMIEGDMVDERSFEESKVCQQIEGFMSLLASPVSPSARSKT